MTYWLLAFAVTLSAFVLAFGAASLIAIPVTLPIARRAARLAPASRAGMLFRLRIAPVVSAASFALLLVLPTFVYYEPLHTGEALSLTLAVAAAAGFALAAASAVRAALAWRSTRTLAARWRESGRRLADVAAPVPVIAIPHAFPLVAVVGWARPMLYVSEEVIARCTADELRAMVAHECAHIRAHDNLKRLALRACPGAPFARALERAWEAAAEQAADAAAASGSRSGRLDLAQALVTVARLASHARLDLPVSAFFAGGSIDTRVRLLLEPLEPVAARPWRRWIAPVASILFGVAFLLLAPAIHQAMESLIRLLP